MDKTRLLLAFGFCAALLLIGQRALFRTPEPVFRKQCIVHAAFELERARSMAGPESKTARLWEAKLQDLIAEELTLLESK